VVLVFIGPDTTVFGIAPSRSLKVLATQLGIDTDAEALPEGRQVLLSSDFYTVYQSLGRPEGVDNLWCWAHIRRYFIRAGDAHPELAAWPTGRVERIAALYTAHTAITAATPTSPAHTLAIAQFCAALNTIDADATPNPAIPTCCTRPARRSSPPWTGNGTAWPTTSRNPWAGSDRVSIMRPRSHSSRRWSMRCSRVATSGPEKRPGKWLLDLITAAPTPQALHDLDEQGIAAIMKPRSPRLAKTLPSMILAALDAQTVAVPGTAAFGRVITGVAAQLRDVHTERDTLAAYAGLAPVTRRSGSSIKGETRSQRGNHALKSRCSCQPSPASPTRPAAPTTTGNEPRASGTTPP